MDWKNELGVVGTIYEEEDEISASSSFSSIPSLQSSPSHSPHLSIQQKPWFSGKSHDEDVVIHVQGKRFRLHKQPLMAKSDYLKRQLTEFPEITLSPPLNITAQTFTLVADFCCGAHVAVTPFNVAALRTAAELLGMTESGGENLQQITEAYFCRVVGVNMECASIVLQSCFPLLPEAETAAALVSRCIEALSLTAGADVDAGCLDGFKNVQIDDLKLILESVSQRLSDSHDFVYKIIDIYLKENNAVISEDEKIQMCNYIDCSVLSAAVLMHAVQNPRMPLRFVVQAMFLQQLNTRHSIITAAGHHHHNRLKVGQNQNELAATTLGAILERDAALRQVSQLKSIMSATNTRIQTLEEELTGMRKLLDESDSVKNRPESGRSASFRFSSDTHKIERAQNGSVSSLSYRDVAKKVKTEASSSSEGSSEGSPSFEKSIGRRLINSLKSAFRLQKKKCESKGQGQVKNGEVMGNEVIIIKKNQAFHKRNPSQF